MVSKAVDDVALLHKTEPDSRQPQPGRCLWIIERAPLHRASWLTDSCRSARQLALRVDRLFRLC